MYWITDNYHNGFNPIIDENFNVYLKLYSNLLNKRTLFEKTD
jgi:hypothetical protein